MKILSIELPPFKLQAILENGATQLQVPLNLQPKLEYDAIHQPNSYRKGFQFYQKKNPSRALGEFFSPFGRKGDYLYIKEQWSTIGPTSQNYLLRATTPKGSFEDLSKSTPWQPARTMPQAAARYWLRIKRVSIQRVQDLTREQAIAEGPKRYPEKDIEGFAPAYIDHFTKDGFCLGSKVAFQQSFKSIHGRLAWDKNFWVWVVEFELSSRPVTDRDHDGEGFKKSRTVNSLDRINELFDIQSEDDGPKENPTT